MPRLPSAAAPPDGLVYAEDVLSDREERAVLDVLAAVDWQPVEMRGQVARRQVRHYGLRYDYEARELLPTAALPPALEPLRAAAAALAGLPAEALVQVLLTRYPPGATIGWHRDAPMFGTVVGVSLAAPCRLRFLRAQGGPREVWELQAAPRSGYALTGAARWSWQHSIPAVAAERYSVTFRTLRSS